MNYHIMNLLLRDESKFDLDCGRESSLSLGLIIIFQILIAAYEVCCALNSILLILGMTRLMLIVYPFTYSVFEDLMIEE